MGDGCLAHKQGEVTPEVWTVPFGHQTCLTHRNDPVNPTRRVSHKPALTGTGYATFLWLLRHQALYKPLHSTARDGCQADLFKDQRDTSLPPLT